MTENANVQPLPPGLSPPGEASRYCTFCRASFRMEIPRCPRDGAPVEIRETDPLLGMVLGGRYRILSLLGFGGMGRVYRAESLGARGTAAVKVLYGDLAADEKMVARFKREARAISRLSSPHIVSIRDFGATAEGLLYLVMELLTGRPLHEAISKDGPFSPERSLHITRQIALALDHAHTRGLIHRDLKPANVILSNKNGDPNFATILDFGLARMTQVEDPRDSEMLTSMGVIRGTPEFMSPEQARGLELDHRSDLYALGVLLFLMLTQRFPFPRPKSRLDVLTMHVMTPPYPLAKFITASETLESLTTRLLAKEAKNRFQSGNDLVLAIEQILSGGVESVDIVLDDVDDEPTRIFALPSEKTPGNTEQVLSGFQKPRIQPLWIGIGVFSALILAILFFVFSNYLSSPNPNAKTSLNATPSSQNLLLPTKEIEDSKTNLVIPVPPVENEPSSSNTEEDLPITTPKEKISKKKNKKPNRKSEAIEKISAKKSYDTANKKVKQALRERGVGPADLATSSNQSVHSLYRRMKELASSKKYKEAEEAALRLVPKIQSFTLDRHMLSKKVDAIQREIEGVEKGKGNSVAAPLNKKHQEISSQLYKVAFSASSAQYESINRQLNALRQKVRAALQ